MQIKEINWNKERGNFQQKIQFLQAKLLEAKEREDSLKKMNENILSTLNDSSGSDKKLNV